MFLMFLINLIILIRFIRFIRIIRFIRVSLEKGEGRSRIGGVFGVVSFFCNFVECDVLIRQRFRRFLMQLTLWRL